jgi:excisionase family DNA binding protein
MKYHTTKQAAEILGVSERRVRAMIKQKHFKNLKKRSIKYEWLISEDEIKKRLALTALKLNN